MVPPKPQKMVKGYFSDFRTFKGNFKYHWWILEEKTDVALGLYFISQDGRGGHPLMVCQYTKDHLCSIIPWPIRWQGYDTIQMILGILGHHQRVAGI